MTKKNSIFIATSIDGFIADKDGGIDWLNSVPNPDNIDMGYGKFISEIDAVIMGKNTFEKVCSFEIEWPYNIPVFVLSNSMGSIPDKYSGKVILLNGSPENVLSAIHKKGYNRLYIDGGKIIQSFLREDLIDDMIITTIPLLLGEGIPLFSDLSYRLEFDCVSSVVYLNAVAQNHFVRRRKKDEQ